jgi:hypothetical protein
MRRGSRFQHKNSSGSATGGGTTTGDLVAFRRFIMALRRDKRSR